MRRRLRRLERRLAIGLFLDIWPTWTVASLVVAGLVALICRMFVPGAASTLPFLWLLPAATALSALIACYSRRYSRGQVVAIADWLGGGHGMLLTLADRVEPAWEGSPLAQRATEFALPRLRPWRRLSALLPATAFLAAVLVLPQRPALEASAALSEEIAANLAGTVVALKEQALITPEEEKKLADEIDRIRRGAEERVDASSWEAADAMRERLAANLSDKQDALEWAKASLERYAAAQTAPSGQTVEASGAELTTALEQLARSGLLANAPAELQQLLNGGKLPTDKASLDRLLASLARHLAETGKRFGSLGRLGKEFGRFNPAEFPLDSSRLVPDGDGRPGRGGVNRGRADAPLTWGQESQPFDRFKPEALPPGAGRPDDWSPVMELPGAPDERPELSASSGARQYAADAGSTAWRRSLRPRHQSAVKKYFEK